MSRFKKWASKFEPHKFSSLKKGQLIFFVSREPGLSHFYGIVISKNKTKKKWLRKYKILTSKNLWEVDHEFIEKNYRIRIENKYGEINEN